MMNLNMKESKGAKRLTALLLAGMLSLGMLSGCGAAPAEETAPEESKQEESAEVGESKEEAATEEAPAEDITIKFWCNTNTPWIAGYNKIIERFEEANPGYHVELTDYPMKEMRQKMQLSMMDGAEGADVYAMWGGQAPTFISGGGLSKVPDYIVEDIEADYMEPCLGIYKYNGYYYGVAMEYNLEYGGMIVNKKMFDAAGASYPTTWEELRETSKKLAVQENGQVKIKGFDMIDSDALFCNFLAMILQQGGQYRNEDNTVNFATPEGVKAMDEILDMIKSGESDLNDIVDGKYGYTYTMQDRGYMASVGSWAVAEGANYGLTYGEDYEYVPVPQYGEKMAFASETGWGLVVPEKAAQKEAAWKFISFFIQPENLVEMNIAASQLPPRKSMLNNETYLEAMPHVAFLLDILENGQWMGPYNTSNMRTHFLSVFQKLVAGDYESTEAALKEASDLINAESIIQ